jgi:hypothetical protein
VGGSVQDKCEDRKFRFSFEIQNAGYFLIGEIEMTLPRNITCLVAAILLSVLAENGHAAVILSYDSGVTAATGQSGAADPSTQGWTLTNAAGNQYSDGYDSGDGGWRTVDGTGSGPANYSQTLNATAQTALTTDPGWEISWTLALDKDALGSAGGSVSNYYVSPNNGNQNNLVTLIDLAADSLGFAITHLVDSSNNLLLQDTSGGSGTYNTGIDTSAFPGFATFSLVYDRTAGTATLDYVAGTATLNPGAPLIGGRNAVYFGAGSSGGQGSAIWNEVSLATVPEPTTGLLAIFGFLGVAMIRRRKK